MKNGREILGCDSVYAVNGAFSDEWKKFFCAKDLITEINKVLPPDPKNFDVILTGGEPSLQFGNAILHEVLEHFDKHEIWVESNGSVNFEMHDALKNLNFTLSVKLAHSGEAKFRRVVPEALKNLAKNAKNVVMKFVVNTADESEEREIDEILGIFEREVPVYLMPLGQNVAEIDLRLPAILALCLRRGWKVCDRLHIRIFGDRRGV